MAEETEAAFRADTSNWWEWIKSIKSNAGMNRFMNKLNEARNIKKSQKSFPWMVYLSGY